MGATKPNVPIETMGATQPNLPIGTMGATKPTWRQSGLPDPETSAKLRVMQDSLGDLFIPDLANAADTALSRTTHLGVGAHQDDLEFMALEGILQAYESNQQWFGGVICTDGSGSARAGRFAGFSDAQMVALRHEEQREAARIGRYGFVAQLGLPSSAVKDRSDPTLVEKLKHILQATRPEVIYTHNPADKHPTHVAVLRAVLTALRDLPATLHPRQFIGCEVWRGLDWLSEEHKVCMDVSRHPELAEQLNAVFESQIAGGKRYDLAVRGRRIANATFLDSHAVDGARQVIYGLDLMPLLREPALSLIAFVDQRIDALRNSVHAMLQ